MESWQIYNAARHLLGLGFMQKLYTRSSNLIYRWAADPVTNEKSALNPIDRIKKMFEELQIRGRGDIARAGVDIMAKPLGGHFAFFSDAESDKGTIDGEATDMTVAIGELVATCRQAVEDGQVDNKEMGEILEKLRIVKDELNQLFAVIKAKQIGRR